MRKTTAPKERKYLTDREFNTFGRGAIEDAPAELLYGKGALAEAYNVNCYPQYFEGRSGSRLFSKAKTEVALSFHMYGSPDVTPGLRKYEGENIVRLPTFGFGAHGESTDTWRYLDWPDGGRDVILKIANYKFGTHETNPAAFVDNTDGRSDGKGGPAGGFVPMDDVFIRGIPVIMQWHNTLRMFVRLESEQFNVAEWDIQNWKRVFPLDGMINSPFGSGRSTFIETDTGGFIYNPPNPHTVEFVSVRKTGGIFKWNADENVAFRVNLNAPVKMPSYNDWRTKGIPPKHIYRYLFTGVRLRGKSRFEGGLVDFETPTSDHDFNAYYGVRGRPALEDIPDELLTPGAAKNAGPVNPAEPIILTGFEWADADRGTMTHLAVYRTLDLETIDLDDPKQTKFNSPNGFALVADVPLSFAFYGNLAHANGDPAGRYTLTLSYGELKGWDEGSVFTARHDAGWRSEPMRDKYFDKTFVIERILSPTSARVYGEADLAGSSLYIRPPSGLCFRVKATAVINSADHSKDHLTDTLILAEGNQWLGGELIKNLGSALLGKPLYLSDGEVYSIINYTTKTITYNEERWAPVGSNPPTEWVETTAEVVDTITLSRNVVGLKNDDGTLHTNEIYFAASCLSNPREQISDNVSDDILRARTRDWFPRTRFRKPLPDCGIAAAVPGFILCASEGESKLYYTDDDGKNPHILGSYNPVQLNEQVKDQIQHAEVFPDVVAIFGAKSTWNFPVGVQQRVPEYDGSPWGYGVIDAINMADKVIGCVEYASIQRIAGGEIILVTRESEAAAVRVFNGHSYGSNLLEDGTLGMARNKNRMRSMRGSVGIYREDLGYVVWRANLDGQEEEALKSLAAYCFRLAIRSEQGGGQSEYGGERWLWPDVQAASVVHGYDPTGRRITLIEDARTGYFYEVGIAEQWLDREDGGAGFEIPTRAALPIIADGYKWQKHLETHIAMRCWKSEYRGAEGFTKDGFKPEHKIGLKIYEDGELIVEASALQDINRNGDYAYLKKVEARRIQEVIETTTSAYKVSQIIAKVQTSDREALPVNNEPLEVKHQREWRTAVIHLSRNLPCPTYNRADGTEMEVQYVHGKEGHFPGEIGRVRAPTGKPCEAFWVATSLIKTVEEDIIDFTVAMWIRPSGQGNLFVFNDPDGEDDDATHELALSLVEDEDDSSNIIIRCEFDGCELLRYPLKTGVWQHVALRRKVNEPMELISLFVNGVNVINAAFARTVQNSTGGFDVHADVDVDSDFDFDAINIMGTFNQGISFQKTWDDVDDNICVWRRAIIGQGRNTEYYDVWLMLSAVSAASIKTYYDAVLRGGEGWLP